MTGGTARHVNVSMGGVIHDRLLSISARLDLPVREVALRLIMIGLDTSQDLALSKPATEGVARYDRHADRDPRRTGHYVPDSGDLTIG